MTETENKTPSRPPHPISRQKKTSNENPPTILKSVQKQDDYKESKPFSKKYGHAGDTHTRKSTVQHDTPRQTVKQSRTEKHIGDSRKIDFQSKGGTKQSFNQRLQNNIIKDEQQIDMTPPGSKKSVRIQKKQSRSPKKVRDDLIVLNNQQYRLQKEIMEFHKKSRHDLQQKLQSFHLPRKDLESWMDEESPDKSQSNVSTLESTIAHLDYLLKVKRKGLDKLEKKIADNKYLQYVDQLPEEAIAELSLSQQQEDVVQDLPGDRPQLQNNPNASRYSQAMPSIKNRSYGLNLRRTYDVFKDPVKEDDNRSVRPQMEGEEVLVDKGDNRMTLNQKFKDFLLN